jgi:hypothetical protein
MFQLRISLGFFEEESPLDVKFELVKTINKIDRLYFDLIKVIAKQKRYNRQNLITCQ